jgi:hypothetical protein
MSKVYSFRLSEDNPREAQARRVIEAWVSEGYSLRYVIVEALLDCKIDKSDSNEYLYLLKKLQSMIENSNRIEVGTKPDSPLSNTFKAGIVESMKKGIQA